MKQHLLLVIFASLLMLANTQTFAQTVTYTPWQALPNGALKTDIATHGSLLINNFNLVQEQDGKPTLIRGGGFTPASIDWLAKNLGVRTFIDLRGRFSDDKTHQVIALSPALLSQYQAHNQLDRLKNLSPDETERYVKTLANESGLALHYVSISALSLRLIPMLDAASPKNPTAMFCQWGVNRSGTAWGAYAHHLGWPIERAYDTFGIKTASGHIRNTRDIQYGYALKQTVTADTH